MKTVVYNAIAKVQKRLLEMAIEIKRILERNNIKYMIAYGTLLGAVRHKGFIPWDDDFDFFIFEEEYENAIGILRKELPKDMFLEDSLSEPLFFHSWAHVKDNNSVAHCSQFPHDNIYAHKGISIDLYIIYKTKAQDVEPFRFNEHCLYLKRLYELGLIAEDKLIQRQEIEKHHLHEWKNNKNKIVFSSIFNEPSMSENEVFPLKKYSFEGVEFWGFNDSDSVLKKLYGDYMVLPPIEDRKPHYDRVVFFN